MARRSLTMLALCVAYAHSALVSADAPDPLDADVLYLPTPNAVVESMLRLAQVRPGDVLYDLGSGDGRIPIEAARRYGIRAVGIELDARKVAEARRNARRAGVGHLVEFRQEDALKADFSEASVVTLFLFRELNLRLRPLLRKQLRPGARVVSHRFDLGDWAPDRQITAQGHPLYLWTIRSRAP